jgi:hypothetical protein
MSLAARVEELAETPPKIQDVASLTVAPPLADEAEVGEDALEAMLDALAERKRENAGKKKAASAESKPKAASTKPKGTGKMKAGAGGELKAPPAKSKAAGEPEAEIGESVPLEKAKASGKPKTEAKAKSHPPKSKAARVPKAKAKVALKVGIDEAPAASDVPFPIAVSPSAAVAKAKATAAIARLSATEVSDAKAEMVRSGVTLGCPKCRFWHRGCGQCRSEGYTGVRWNPLTEL